jgi:hypothetical protein
VDPEAFVDSLYRLSTRQWRVILSLLVCANLIVYGAVALLWWAYVYRQPPLPELPTGPLLTPTLRPTYTPTWTPVVEATRAATSVPDGSVLR